MIIDDWIVSFLSSRRAALKIEDSVVVNKENLSAVHGTPALMENRHDNLHACSSCARDHVSDSSEKVLSVVLVGTQNNTVDSVARKRPAQHRLSNASSHGLDAIHRKPFAGDAEQHPVRQQEPRLIDPDQAILEMQTTKSCISQEAGKEINTTATGRGDKPGVISKNDDIDFSVSRVSNIVSASVLIGKDCQKSTTSLSNAVDFFFSTASPEKTAEQRHTAASATSSKSHGHGYSDVKEPSSLSFAGSPKLKKVAAGKQCTETCHLAAYLPSPDCCLICHAHADQNHDNHDIGKAEVKKQPSLAEEKSAKSDQKCHEGVQLERRDLGYLPRSVSDMTSLITKEDSSTNNFNVQNHVPPCLVRMSTKSKNMAETSSVMDRLQSALTSRSQQDANLRQQVSLVHGQIDEIKVQQDQDVIVQEIAKCSADAREQEERRCRLKKLQLARKEQEDAQEAAKEEQRRLRRLIVEQEMDRGLALDDGRKKRSNGEVGRVISSAEDKKRRLHDFIASNKATSPRSTTHILPQRRADMVAPLITADSKSEYTSYEISPQRSCSESEEEDAACPRKHVPDWARTEALFPVLTEQSDVDPDEIFPNQTKTCSIAAVFTCSDEDQGDGRRNSSGNWFHDRLTWREELAYKQDMGYVGKKQAGLCL